MLNFFQTFPATPTIKTMTGRQKSSRILRFLTEIARDITQRKERLINKKERDTKKIKQKREQNHALLST